ncbi:MAG: hypothetical protein GT601_08595 [Acidaminobacter sp.]|uniref:hypothetical protein n=1 Tax=Acidaminobacter sp. TaxID=1872102 RepID=UPI00137E394A|nr:hypothetical protein [Acidaminobacter sp.]MZQ97723.1 hypothetical protein [Acidaminobacter sp.]
MNKRVQALNHMKMNYRELKAPEKLDEVINNAILEGQRDKQTMTRKINSGERKYSQALRRVLYASAAALVIFVGSLNASPMFASKLAEIPVLGQLVKILTFTDGKASGGMVTDGTDISGISTQTENGKAQFIIHFDQDGASQDLASAYKVVYAQKPETLLFEISGVRMLSALEDFEKIKESPLVTAVYPVVTLDDSMVRFMIVFSESISYEIREMASPASLVVEVETSSEAAAALESYRVRTVDMPRGEGLAILEETIMNQYPKRRILPSATESDLFFLEIGQLDSEALAVEMLDELRAMYPGMEIFIEKTEAQ